MEKVSRGVYIANDVWPDELFICNKGNGAIIYSEKQHYICTVLSNREYSSVCVTVHTGI